MKDNDIDKEYNDLVKDHEDYKKNKLSVLLN